LTAFDGTKHRLNDYRGKVVVLDFWYANCGWCIKSFPQIKQLVKKYKGQDVVVLGMNVDAEEESAAAVIERLELKYTNLKAKSVVPAYEDETSDRVIGYPTLFVLDQTGRISDVHFGYSPELSTRVGATIDALLKSARSK
jgi:peroxiredoxin